MGTCQPFTGVCRKQSEKARRGLESQESGKSPEKVPKKQNCTVEGRRTLPGVLGVPRRPPASPGVARRPCRRPCRRPRRPQRPRPWLPRPRRPRRPWRPGPLAVQSPEKDISLDGRNRAIVVAESPRVAIPATIYRSVQGPGPESAPQSAVFGHLAPSAPKSVFWCFLAFFSPKNVKKYSKSTLWGTRSQVPKNTQKALRGALSGPGP